MHCDKNELQVKMQVRQFRAKHPFGEGS